MTTTSYKLQRTEIIILFAEIEKNNCFSICTQSDLNKIRKESIKRYDLINGANHA